MYPIPNAYATCRKRELGGGVVYDLGIYTIQASQWAFQEPPQKIESTGLTNAEGIDDDVSATLTYSGGRTARIRMSSREKLDNTAVIKGTKGQVTVSASDAHNDLPESYPPRLAHTHISRS